MIARALARWRAVYSWPDLSPNVAAPLYNWCVLLAMTSLMRSLWMFVSFRNLSLYVSIQVTIVHIVCTVALTAAPWCKTTFHASLVIGVPIFVHFHCMMVVLAYVNTHTHTHKYGSVHTYKHR
jgi:hypothetical protein